MTTDPPDALPHGHLAPGEPHPAAYAARRWLADHLAGSGPAAGSQLVEAFASCAIEGNRQAEICGETLRRLLAGEPVSDRYVLGAAWVIREMAEREGGRS